MPFPGNREAGDLTRRPSMWMHKVMVVFAIIAMIAAAVGLIAVPIAA